MTDRPAPPHPDPLLTEILAIGARLDPDNVEPDLSDPALLVLVDRAVAPYAHLLTADGLEEARRRAAWSLATHPDIGPVLERVRSKLASGVRPTRSAEQLGEVARKRRGSGSR